MCTGKIRVALTLTSLLTIAESVSTITEAQKYLSQYGYLPALESNSVNSALSDGNTLIQAVKEFQNFVGLNITGEVNNETMDFMSLPRCGVRDKVDFGNNERSERYILIPTRWNIRHLTYNIIRYSEILPNATVDSELRRAFDVWSGYTNLKFTRVEVDEPDIKIGFYTGWHGNCGSFDGRPSENNILAHASAPNDRRAYIHFDDAEPWTVDFNGTNFLTVALHEIGHALGLHHSNVLSIMTPFYHTETKSKLHSDDIDAIQALYGKNLCKDPTIDTIFNSADGETYIFKGDLYYQIFNNSVVDGYPKYITQGWSGLPSNIDAAFTKSDNKTYFFKGDKYWKYTGKTMDDNYPAKIATDFNGFIGYWDAAAYVGEKNEIYFFKVGLCWIVDGETQKFKSIASPLISHSDAAFVHTNGSAYIFKGEEYYDFDSVFNYKSTLHGRSIAKDWFGC